MLLNVTNVSRRCAVSVPQCEDAIDCAVACARCSPPAKPATVLPCSGEQRAVARRQRPPASPVGCQALADGVDAIAVEAVPVDHRPAAQHPPGYDRVHEQSRNLPGARRCRRTKRHNSDPRCCRSCSHPSSGSRNTRGLGLPGWGSGVTEPAHTCRLCTENGALRHAGTPSLLSCC